MIKRFVGQIAQMICEPFRVIARRWVYAVRAIILFAMFSVVVEYIIRTAMMSSASAVFHGTFAVVLFSIFISIYFADIFYETKVSAPDSQFRVIEIFSFSFFIVFLTVAFQFLTAFLNTSSVSVAIRWVTDPIIIILFGAYVFVFLLTLMIRYYRRP